MLVSIVEFERFWHFDLLALLLAFKMFFFAGKVFCILIDSLHVSLMTAFIFILRLRVISSRCIFIQLKNNQPSIFLFKVKSGNTRTICEICSKLKILWSYSNHINDDVLVSLFLTLKRCHTLFTHCSHMSHIVLFPLFYFHS